MDPLTRLWHSCSQWASLSGTAGLTSNGKTARTLNGAAHKSRAMTEHLPAVQMAWAWLPFQGQHTATTLPGLPAFHAGGIFNAPDTRHHRRGRPRSRHTTLAAHQRGQASDRGHGHARRQRRWRRNCHRVRGRVCVQTTSLIRYPQRSQRSKAQRA